MYGALENHRMSLLALGNKHVYGLDGIPQDLDQAYRKLLLNVVSVGKCRKNKVCDLLLFGIQSDLGYRDSVLQFRL